MKNILITGGFGFIGFNAILQWKKNHPDLNLFNVDSETYAAQYLLKQKKEILDSLHIESFREDIRNREPMEKIIVDKKIDTIVNFAAESHVDNSISNPNIFFETNILGTVNLLNLSKTHNLRFHQISTDEVIGPVSPEDKKDCSENAPFNPSSPYSSSKASAELIAISYFKTFNTNITISRCTNNIGEWQNPEKLVPKTILNAIYHKPIPIYGNGKQRRFWIDVNSHNSAIFRILKHGKPGNIYNIAPNKKNLITNIDLVHSILNSLNQPLDLIEHIKDRPAHDICYYLDGSKLENELNWKDTIPFESTLERTISFYAKLNNEEYCFKIQAQN